MMPRGQAREFNRKQLSGKLQERKRATLTHMNGRAPSALKAWWVLKVRQQEESLEARDSRL